MSKIKNANHSPSVIAKSERLQKKYETLMNPEIYESMGMTECHGKMYYRFRNIKTKVINHLAISHFND